MPDAIGVSWELLKRWVLQHSRLSALVLGVIAALGFEPTHFWWLTLLALGGLTALIARAESAKSAFILGWMFGWSHFTLGNTWFAHAFTYQDAMPHWLGWLASPLVALYLAIYPALAAWLAHQFVARLARGGGNGLALPLAFAAAWILTEWLRSWVFTGYPWNPLGIIFLGDFSHSGVAMLAQWMGTYALSGFAVAIAGLLWWSEIHHKRLLELGIGLALVAGMYLPAGSGNGDEDGTINYTVVQPDVRQGVLNDPAYFDQNFIKAANLSLPDAQLPNNNRIVFWPESGLPDYIQDGYPPLYYQRFTAGGDPKFARSRIARVIGRNALLLTGAIDLEFDGQRAIGARNAITAIDGQGDIVGSYYKSHLVPFGEYVPLRSVLEPIGIARFVPGSFDFLPGPGPETRDFGDKGRVGMLVCYEVIFSGNVVDPANRPDYIFNPSNDGWYGAFGPPQHLAQARLRAIEEGLPVVRSTTTGVSAVIDAYGVVRNYAPMHVAQRLDGTIPPPREPTLFARLGHFLTLSWGLLFILLSLLAMRRERAGNPSEPNSIEPDTGKDIHAV